MLKSLKSWLNLPLIIKPCLKRDGTGAKEFGESTFILCYAEGTVQTVTNKEGKEIVSHKQIYVDGTVALTEMDNIVFENAEYEIQAISYFYRRGAVDVKVVYL
jgi:hypothetical protein